ncbi:Epoxide hydrolase 4 [Picochlorum sp. SENEW3]|nr:Epoxide hydrolase 4 [Picochlorum sp. SENEW3]WPT14489.1 Epoxide hydrolase 4 [Picochlorum sp. SENEW3]
MGLVSGFLNACLSLVFGALTLVYCVCVSFSLLKDFVLSPRHTLAVSDGRKRRPDIPGTESFFIQTSKIRLHALRNDNHAPSKPLMLFLHGFPENSYSWRNQMNHFRHSYTVVALDMRGFGDSDAPTGLENYLIDELCLDVCAVVKACGYEECILVGHDWGGMVAWNVAANFPDIILGLVTLCSPHPLAYQESACFTLRQAYLSSYFLFFTTPSLPELYLKSGNGARVRELLVTGPMGIVSVGALTEEDIEYYVSALSRPGRLTAGLNYYRAAMMASSKRSKRFLDRTLQANSPPGIPILQLYADRDGAFLPSMFETCSFSKKHVALVRLANCSHWAQQDCPQTVNSHIEAFTDEIKNNYL